MSGTLTVKAYLTVDKNPEIRRFAIDQSVCASYTYLGSKITQVFPQLTNKKINLFWKDSDGDLVSFSTDDELTDALGYVNDGVFRVHIQTPTETASERTEPCHKNVLCDGCELEICGPRFKCISCPDYDLCCKCEEKGMHQEHDMLRMCTPRPPGYMNFAFGAFGGQHPPPPPPPHGPHGPHGPHHPPPPPPPPHHGEGGPPFHGPPHHGPGFWNPQVWHWKRMWKRAWRKWMRDNGDQANPWGFPDPSSRDPSEDGSRCGDDSLPKEPKVDKEQMQKEGAEGKKGDDPKEGCSQERRNSGEECLRNIGDSVAAMLDPLGIDVHVDIEHNNQRQHVHGPPGRGRGRCRGRNRGWGNWANFAPPWAGGAGTWGGAWAGRGGAWSWAGPHGARGGCHPPPQFPGFGRQTSQESNDVEMMQDAAATDAASAAGAAAARRAAEAASAAATKSAQDMNMGSPAPPSEPSECGEWTMLGREKESGKMDTDKSQEEEDEDCRVVYPTVPSAPVTAPPNQRIVDALEQMKAMGYSDDGGWLTSLLEAKGGDINKVLDSLQPKPQ